MTSRAVWARRALVAAVVAVHLYNFPYLEGVLANEKARVLTTMALATRGTFDVGVEAARWGGSVDTVQIEGHLYANKAPGVSLLGVPAYAVMRLFGEPTSLRPVFYWLRLTAVTVPCLLLLWLFAGFLRRFADAVTTDVAIVGYALGTLALPYSILFMGHQLAAALIASAWALLARRRAHWDVAAGVLCGVAFLAEYQAAIAIAALGIYALVQSRASFARLVAGSLPGTLALAAYHVVHFGGPFTTAYAHLGDRLTHTVTDVSVVPQLRKFVHAFVSSSHGLFAFSPWLLLGLIGLRRLFATHRAEAWLCGAMIAAYAWFGSSLAPWTDSWDAGPRYVACIVPFLVVPAAAFLGSVANLWARAAACGLVLASSVIHTLMIAVLPYYPPSFSNPFWDFTMDFLAHGRVAYNAGWLIGLHGLTSAVPYLLLVGAATLWVFRPLATATPRRCAGFAAVIVLTAAAHLTLLALAPHRGSANTHTNLILNWEPPPP